MRRVQVVLQTLIRFLGPCSVSRAEKTQNRVLALRYAFVRLDFSQMEWRNVKHVMPVHLNRYPEMLLVFRVSLGLLRLHPGSLHASPALMVVTHQLMVHLSAFHVVLMQHQTELDLQLVIVPPTRMAPLR